MTVEQIKTSVDLVEYIRSKGIQLKKKGQHDLVGLCPFHNDTEPSLVVTPRKQLWHCMGCDRGGSVIDFVMEQDSIELAEAVERLSGRACEVRTPTAEKEKQPACSPLAPERANQLLERVVTLYEKTFADVPEGRAYLEGRGIADAGLFGQHRVGYCNGRLPEMLPSDGPIRDELKALGVLLDNGRERFTGCVVFPVFNEEGDFVTLYGRYTGGKSEARNAKSETSTKSEAENPKSEGAGTFGRGASEPRGKRHLFLPGRPTGIWNLAAAGTYTDLVLVESVIDALSLEMAGYHNVLSIQGTNGLKDADIATLEACGVRKLTLLLDGDDAGTKAAARLADKLSSFSRELRTLPEGHDPNSFLVQHGPQSLAELLAGQWQPDAGVPPPHPRQRARVPSGHPQTSEGGGEEGGCVRPGTVPPAVRNRAADADACPEPAETAACESAPYSPEPTAAASGSGPGDQVGRSDRDAEDMGVQGDHLPAGGSGAEPLSPGGFAVTYGLRRYEVRGIEKGARKLKVTVRVEHAGKLHVDTLDLYSARGRRCLCQDVARIFEQAAETIEADLAKLLVAVEQFDPEAVAVAQSADPVEAMGAAERREAEAFGRSEDLLERILADFETCGLVGERHNKLLCYLAAVSRKTDEPLSVLILSSSGAGKTALQDAALAFCPPEDVVKLTSLTGKALFYKDETSLKHKVLALEEGAGAEEAGYAIRNLISAGELVIEATIKDLVTGKLTTMENRVRGPTSVFYTVTDPEVDPETRSRFFVVGIDESPEQTRAILEFQRRRHELHGLRENGALNRLLRVHRNFQRLLKPLAVVNPYASQLTYGDHRLQARRDQPKYLNLIKAVAFLRQMRKQVRNVGCNGTSAEYVEVDLADIAIANELAVTILGTTLDELSVPSRNLLGLLEAMVDRRTKELAAESATHQAPERDAIAFSRKTIRRHTGWSNYRVHTHLKELVEYEYVLVESGRNGSTYRYRLAYDGQGKDGERFMLGLKDVAQFAPHRDDA